jgi:hypothetical protein
LIPAVHHLSSHVFQRHNWVTLVLFRLARHVQKAKSKPSCCVLHLVRGTNVNLVFVFLNTSFKGTVFVSSHQTSLLLLQASTGKLLHLQSSTSKRAAIIMSEFQTATENFLKWFKSVGGEFRDDLLEITDLRSRGAGRGIRERASPNMSKETNIY